MRYWSHTSPPPLGDFVDYLWLLRDAPPHARERIVPSGTLELVINLREDEIRIYDPTQSDRCRRFSGGVVSGAYRDFFVIDTQEHAEIIGVHFRPGGASPFLGVPASELSDRHVDLDALWGRAAVELRERLCEAATPGERFRLLEDALLAYLYRPVRRRSAVRVALDHLGSTDAAIREVADHVRLSHRHFIEVFAEEIGMTPKLFSRVRRFQRAIALARRAPTVDWARLAADCGYCDQSHMIRDFVAFSGFTPTDYLRRRAVDVKDLHVAVT